MGVCQFFSAKYRAMSGRAKPYLAHAPLAALLLFSISGGGCSITMPMMGLSYLEDEPAAARSTSSLAAPLPIAPSATAPISAKSPPGFPRDLGPEDLRRAHGALALALDPQGNGKNVSWDNPQTGMKGQITPLGSPFLRADEICRDFMAATALQAGPLSHKGTACRPSGGEWAIKAMDPAGTSGPAKAAQPAKTGEPVKKLETARRL